VFHTVRLEDTVELAPGQPAIDLLDGGAIDAFGGTRANSVEFEGGVFWRGLGVRAIGNWQDGSEITAGPGQPGLTFSDRFTLNLRLFGSFDTRYELLARYPILRRFRVFARVDNVTGSTVEVRDAAGNTPAAFQEGFLVPLGTDFVVGLRKLW